MPSIAQLKREWQYQRQSEWGAPVLFAPERVDTETLPVFVLRVFDGDGFLARIWHPQQKREIEIGVRFGFIDAPEMDQAGGEDAKKFLEHIIAGKWLELSILLKFDTGQVFDRHKRLICVPYLPSELPPSSSLAPLNVLKNLFSRFNSTEMMRNVELEMVLNGYAWVVEKYGPDEKYLEALEDARANKRGIWANDHNVAPWHFKRQQNGARRGKREKFGQQTLFARAEAGNCPKCSGALVERNGKYGTFVGCSNFPKCRYTCSNSGGTKR